MKGKKMEYILFKGANCVFYRLKKKRIKKQHCQTVLITYVSWARSLENVFNYRQKMHYIKIRSNMALS